MSKKTVTILAIDGGGIRGIIPAMVLSEIERQTGKNIPELFDIVSGSSTGAVMALGLTMPGENGKPRFSPDNIIEFYEKEMAGLFQPGLLNNIRTLWGYRSTKYSVNYMRKIVGKYFKGAKLSQSLTNVLIPAYEIESGRGFFFRRSEARKNAALDFELNEILMASSAAIPYLEPYLIEPKGLTGIKHMAFLDGALVANNPALCAYVEAKTMFPDAQNYVIVSLGCGIYSVKMLYERIGKWGVLTWLRPFINIILSGSTDVVDHQLKVLHQTEGDQLSHYYRLQPRLSGEEIEFDETRELKIHEVKLIASELVNENKKEISEISELLLKLHKDK